MLCQNGGVVYAYPEFSLICLECGMEFKLRLTNPMQNRNCLLDPAEAAKTVIEKFNRRAKE